jgi:hypothetical protein
MSGITGQGTTFNLPNYTGRLFTVSPTETKFLSMIGGLQGAAPAKSTEFDWQTYDLRAAAIRGRLEGANAPTSEERVRANVNNVLQIFHEAVEVSYTKIAAVAQLAGDFTPNANEDNPVVDEVAWQITQELKIIATDLNLSLFTGTYAKPADNTAPRLTRGLVSAIVSNVSANGGTLRDLTTTIVLDAIQSAWTGGGFREGESATLFVGADLKRAITKLFITDKNYREQSRTIGGVACTTIETDFGTLNVVLDRYVPANQIVGASLDSCRLRYLDIPGKSGLFVEPLAKTGSAERSQLYGEFGLEYGHEKNHFLIKDVKAPAGS